MASIPFLDRDIIVGLPEVKLDGISVGYLAEGKGVDIVPINNFLQFKYGRPLLVVKQIVIEQLCSVKLSFAQFNPDNIANSLVNAIVDDQTLPGQTIVYWGGSSSFQTKQLDIIFTKPEGRVITFQAYKVVSFSKPTFSFIANKWTEIDTEWQLLADFTKPAGERYFRFIFDNEPAS